MPSMSMVSEISKASVAKGETERKHEKVEQTVKNIKSEIEEILKSRTAKIAKSVTNQCASEVESNVREINRQMSMQIASEAGTLIDNLKEVFGRVHTGIRADNMPNNEQVNVPGDESDDDLNAVEIPFVRQFNID